MEMSVYLVYISAAPMGLGIQLIAVVQPECVSSTTTQESHQCAPRVGCLNPVKYLHISLAREHEQIVVCLFQVWGVLVHPEHGQTPTPTSSSCSRPRRRISLFLGLEAGEATCSGHPSTQLWRWAHSFVYCMHSIVRHDCLQCGESSSTHPIPTISSLAHMRALSGTGMQPIRARLNHHGSHASWHLLNLSHLLWHPVDVLMAHQLPFIQLLYQNKPPPHITPLLYTRSQLAALRAAPGCQGQCTRERLKL